MTAAEDSRPAEAAIRAHGLTKRFGDVEAVAGVDLEVPVGSIFGFLGPNGAGKTTTIRLLLGLLEPDAGSAEVLGFDVRRRSAEIRSRVGVLLEHDGLYVRLTARQNLDFFAQVARIPRAERRERVKALLAEFGLGDRIDDRVEGFSRGMRQKLALARAFLGAPQILFLDEPTSGLDTPSAVALRQELVRLARERGVTVFLTTHNLLEAEKVCDRVAVVRSGRLLAQGRPEEIRGGGPRRMEIVGHGFAPALRARLEALPGVVGLSGEEDGPLLVELEPDASGSGVVRTLVEGGAEVESARTVRESLEESFLALLAEEGS